MLRSHLRPVPFVALALIAWARPATASDPASTYVVPTRVELLPDDAAATRVVIHGAFFHLTDITAFTYGDPRCGVMYFQCVSGQEAMCRMQWKELRSAISPTTTVCRGFGTLQKLTTATTRAEGEPLGTPDAWDLGMGIGMGVYVDNKCPAALKLSCPLSSPVDGGTTGGGGGGGNAGAAGAGGAGGTTGAAGSGGPGGASGGAAGAPGGRGGSSAGSAGGSAGAGAGTTGMAGTGTGAGTAGTGGKPAARSGGGCAIAGAAPSAALPFALLALAALVSGARRRRR